MKRKQICLFMIALTASATTLAFDLPKMPSLGTKAEASASTSNVDAVGSQEVVVHKYLDASTDINQAQQHLASAFGLKDEAAALAATAAALKAGATDKESLEKIQSVSSKSQAAIDKAIKEGAQLSEEGKAEYSKSLLPFATGVMKASKLPPEFSSFSDAAKQQISSANLMEKAQVTSKLSAGMYLVSSAPSFIGNTTTSFKQLLTYGQNNKIPVPADATAALNNF